MRRKLACLLWLSAGCYSGAHGSPAGDGTQTTGDDPSDASDASGDSEGGTDDGPPGEEPEEYDFERAQLRRLTTQQFVGSLRDLLGDDVVVSSDVDPDVIADLFTTVGASVVTTSSVGVERYELATLDATHQVFADQTARADLVGCDPADDDACVSEFLASFGRRAWRRPLDDDELARYVELVATVPGAEDDPWLGLELAVVGILQSPNFLYLVEVGEPDPDVDTRWRYTNWEMAGRLAAFVWAAAPDDELLDAAEAGELVTADGVEAHLDRMLADPRSAPALARFFTELLDLEAADSIAKDPAVYPEATPALFAAMRGEVERVVDRLVFEEDADVRDLFDTRRTFVNADLAELYGMPAPDPALVDEDGFAPYTIPADWARAGVLGTGAFLASGATLTRTSPTKRGYFVQKRFRCTTPPPPPDDVDTEFPPQAEGETTMRERLEQHRTDPTCAACHTLMDPLGLTLEHFDGIGRHREDDNGLPLDVAGELNGASFEGLTGLAAYLREDPAVVDCFVLNAYRFATGAHESDEEDDILDALTTDFAGSGHRFAALARAIATSEGFRFRGRAP